MLYAMGKRGEDIRPLANQSELSPAQQIAFRRIVVR